MSSISKSLMALASLLAAFYLSVSYQYGDPGWRLEITTGEAAAKGEPKDTYDLKSLAILNRAVIHIKENYVDPARISERKMIGAAMEEVQRAVAELLVDVERDKEGMPTRLTVRVGPAEQAFTLHDVGNLWQMSFKFKDIFRFIQDNLVHHDKLRDIEYAAINGMLSTLDPHSVLLRPEDYREMKLSTRGKFGGLGIVISIRDGQLTIMNPIEETPADRAGLKAGDRIVQIELDSTVNMALNDAVNMLRGEPNTKVNIWVLREGWDKPRRFTLTRADIKVKSVAFERLPGRVGLVKVRNFQNTTHDELADALEKLKAKGPLKGVVLDLRGNPGGLLDQAIKVSDLFIDSGPLVTTVGYGDKMREPKMATKQGTVRDLPLVVLTDASSASASEIVAGALKNHRRALLIGQQTFGKGSVQVIYDNKDDSALKLTIAQYLTPGDVSIQSVGVVPDIVTHPVVLTEDETDLFRSLEHRSGEKDLTAHLDHESAELAGAEKPVHVVRYLRDQALHEKIEQSPNDLIVDFEIELARSILLATGATNRPGMLEEAGAVIGRTIADQEKGIVTALEKRGVDWRAPERVAGKPRAEIEIVTDKPENLVRAGETLTLKATVKNVGNGPYVQLRAMTRSDNEYLEGHEMLFGTIPPGESRTWEIPVKLPLSALSRRDGVRLEFKEAQGREPEATALKVGVQELDRPRFAMTYRIDDSKLGNGDGLLQIGEQAELLVSVKNVGEGKSFEVLGTLRNDDKADPDRGIFIKRGRVNTTALEVNAQGDLRFAFKVKDDLLPGAVPMEITVVDAEIREATSEKVVFHIVPKSQAVEQKPTRLVPRNGGEVLLSGMFGSADLPYARAIGHAAADARVKDWYRVPLGGGLYGWVRAADVTVDTATTGGAMRIEPIVPGGPPVITLSQRDYQPETHDESLTFNGEVQGPKDIKDLLIYVNNRKVFFKAHEGGKAAADKLRFSARVPLEQGVNRITFIARQNDEAASRRTVIINRAGAGQLVEAPVPKR